MLHRRASLSALSRSPVPGNLADNAQNHVNYGLRAQAHTISPVLTFAREGALFGWEGFVLKALELYGKVCYNGK